MSENRQQAFLKLKPPCVNLSSVAGKFRIQNASVKDVLQALEKVRDILLELGKDGSLNPQLAEYALFPLVQQVFNETKRLSPRCLEVAVECLTLLVSNGYRHALSSKLGREMLFLMLMLAGAGNNSSQPSSDELKVAAFRCVSEVIKALTLTTVGSLLLEDQSAKNVVDPLVYLLLEGITDSPAEQLQISASETLLQLIKAIKSRVFLASLLPRTVSALTKALRPSTTAKRTKKVLCANLRALRVIIDRTLADRVSINVVEDDEKSALGESWLKATSAQLKNALIQVAKLRTHESPTVHRCLEELSVMIVEECRSTLTDSIPIALETLVMLSAKPDGDSARSTCKHLVITYPENAEMLQSSLNNWSRSLPRIMQGHDEQRKALALERIAAALQILSDSGFGNNTTNDDFTTALVSGISNSLNDEKPRALEAHDGNGAQLSVSLVNQDIRRDFGRFLFAHESQRDTTEQLRHLVTVMKESPGLSNAIRNLADHVAESDGSPQVASFWLILQLLKGDDREPLHLDDFLVTEDLHVDTFSKTSVLADLHATTLPTLGTVFDKQGDDKHTWQMQALAMECTTMYASTFSGDTYRPELMDTLYPILSFLGSPNSILQSHAMTALDKLALSSQYPSVTDMIIDNVDYLVNSVAWKLNTFSLSPEAPQILRMMVRLCGAELIPYLDDLIQSIFAALDSYHGYPEWVETLFTTLRAMVDVSIEAPQLAITQAKDEASHDKATQKSSIPSDILDDLRCRKRRRLEFSRPAEEPPAQAPHRPWTNQLDGPSFPKAAVPDEDMDMADDNNEHLSPMKPPEDEERKLTKPHNLLLSIASSTVPHLASPSPRVRHLLLDLLKDISPLLGRDEDSFLPLINKIWPVIVPRLFADETGHESEKNEEVAYNVCAAADTIAALCANAGDFMSSRIDDIFQQLVRLCKKTRKQVTLATKITNGHVSDNGVHVMGSLESGEAISGPVSLQVVANNPPDGTRKVEAELDQQPRPFQQTTRTSQGQILAALTDLLIAILSHVQVTLDMGDEIMQFLLPLMAHRETVRPALEVYNADTVWLWDSTLQAPSEFVNGDTDTPALRDDLVSLGLSLADTTRSAVG